jgi:hypothetical protein
MLSSNEIAQMFAMQNQAFMNQNTFAHHIGITPPAAGLGGFGTIPRPPTMGPGMEAPFTYGPVGYGAPAMGPGNSFASGTMAAAGSAAGFLGMSMFDPIRGAIGGWRAAGLAGSIAGFAAPVIPAMAAFHMINQTMSGGMQQMGVNSALNNFQFLNPSSRTGMGFTRQDSSAIGESIRSLATLPEMMTSMEELTRLLPKLKSSGVMQGVRDAGEFARRFKDSMTTIKDMSRILGTTLEDAEQFFSHSRSIGMLGRADQIKNALNAQLTSGVTGMNIGQVMQLQAAGAGMSRSIGAGGRMGALATTNLATNLGLAQASGLIGAGAIEDVTGLQGGDAISALSQKMSGLALNFSNTSGGRLMLAGLLNSEGTGLDRDLVRRFNAGSIGSSFLRNRGMGMSNQQKIGMTARQPELAAELAALVGPGGIASMLGDVSGFSGDKLNLLMQRMGGLTFGEGNIALQLRGVGAGQEGMQLEGLRSREIAIRNNTDPEAIIRRIKTKIRNAISEPFNAFGSKMFSSIGSWVEEIIDDAADRHITVLTKDAAMAFSRAATGGSASGARGIFGSAYMSVGDTSPSLTTRLFSGSNFGSRFKRGELDSGMNPNALSNAITGFLGGSAADARIADIEAGTFTNSESAAAMPAITRMKLSIDRFREKGHDRRLMDFRDTFLNRIEAMDPELANAIKVGKSVGGVARQIGGSDKLYGRIQRIAGRNADLGAIMMASFASHSSMDFLASPGFLSGGPDTLRISPLVGGAGAYMDVVLASTAIREAKDELEKSGFSPASTLAMSTNSKIRDIVAKAMKDPTLLDRVFSSDAEKEFGLGKSDIESLRRAVDEAYKLKDPSRAGEALNRMGSAQAGGDVMALRDTLVNAGKEIFESVKNLKGVGPEGTQALMDVATVMSNASKGGILGVEKSFFGSRSAIAKAVQVARTMSPKERNAYFAGSGSLGMVMERAFADVKGLGSSVTADTLRKKFGLDDTAIQNMGFMLSGSNTLTPDRIAALQEAVAADRGTTRAGAMAAAGTTDLSVVTVLREISDVNKLQTTALINVAEAVAIVSKNDKAIALANKARENVSNASGGSKLE